LSGNKLTRTENLKRILNKSERMLQSAETSFNAGFLESAASRAYYSAFHAIQAVLKSVDQTYSKHSTVIAEFQRQFIKTGIFPRQIGKALSKMAKHREIADYKYDEELNSDEVKEDIEKARELLDAVRQYLKLDKT